LVLRKGWYGLAAAKTYIELHPGESVTILESNTSIGGVWAEDRLYPGLKSNNMLGTYEYPDFRMDEATYGVKTGEHIPGTVLSRYLTDFAKHFGILERTRFDTKVVSVLELNRNDGWLLRTSSASAQLNAFRTKKLIVATGLTSQPHIPQLSHMQNFRGRLFHVRDFAKQSDTLRIAKNVIVIGGAKSAWDVCYAYASADIQVDMIIRKSGRGPAWMAPPYVTPAKRWIEKLVHTRFLTWLSPCVWGDEDLYASVRKFLHTTWLGRGIVTAFWKIPGEDVIALNKYDSHPELKKLKPWDPAFYVGSSFSILNYPTSFFDLVREGRVRVHIDEIAAFGSDSLALESGLKLKADTVVLATGWKKEPPFIFLGGAEAGAILRDPSSEMENLTNEADQEIMRRFPSLKTQPKRRSELEATLTERLNHPFRMYRFMVPPAMAPRRNIAYAGMLSCFTTSIVATVQAIWISAFLDNKLDRLPYSQDDMSWQTVLHTQFCKWRYPTGYGSAFPDFVFDAVPYLDMLLRDLDIEPHRKLGKLANIFKPYGPEDYISLVDEWKVAHGKAE